MVTCMFCSNCGKPINEDFRFCPHCGALNEMPEQPHEEPIAPVEENVVEVDETPCESFETIQPETEAAESTPVEPEIEVVESAPIQPESEIEEPIPVQPEPEIEEPIPVQPEPEIVEPTPVEPQVETAQPKKKVKDRRRRGPFRTILAVLVCIVMFAVFCATILVVGVRNFVSEDNLQNTLQTVVQDLDNIPAAGLSDDLDEDATLVDAIIVIAEENGAKLTKRDIEAIAEESELVATLCEKLSVYITDIQEGNSDALLTKEDLTELLYEDRELIYEVTGKLPTDKDIEKIANVVDDTGVLEFTNVKEMKKEMAPVYTGMQYGLSIWSVVALGVVLLLLIILLGVINRWSIMRLTGDVGITLSVSSFLILILALIGPKVLGTLLSALPVSETITYLVSVVTDSWLLNILITLGVGVVLILISCVIRAISNAIRKHREAKALAA